MFKYCLYLAYRGFKIIYIDTCRRKIHQEMAVINQNTNIVIKSVYTLFLSVEPAYKANFLPQIALYILKGTHATSVCSKIGIFEPSNTRIPPKSGFLQTKYPPAPHPYTEDE